MEFYPEVRKEIDAFIAKKGKAARSRIYTDFEKWPESKRGGIVLKSDTAIEYGGPFAESVSFILWGGGPSVAADGTITLIGPDITEAGPGLLPFGRVLFLEVEDFNEDNTYDRYRELDLSRFDLHFEGYMVKAILEQMKEWSRVSKKSVSEGRSLFMLGRSYLEKIKSFEYVKSAELLFITSSLDDVREIAGAGERVTRYLGALKKMVEEMDFDCSGCDYNDLCGDIGSLRAMRKKIVQEKK